MMAAAPRPTDEVVQLRRASGIGGVAMFALGMMWALGAIAGAIYACFDTTLSCTRAHREPGRCEIVSHLLWSAYSRREVDLADVDDVEVIDVPGAKHTGHKLVFVTLDDEKIAISGDDSADTLHEKEDAIDDFRGHRKRPSLELTIDASHAYLAPVGLAWLCLLVYAMWWYARRLEFRVLPHVVQVKHFRAPLAPIVVEIPRREMRAFVVKTGFSKAVTLVLVHADGREEVVLGQVTLESNAYAVAEALNARLAAR